MENVKGDIRCSLQNKFQELLPKLKWEADEYYIYIGLIFV
jgi:hypothetical protein